MNMYIIKQIEEMLKIANQGEISIHDYEKIHELSWDIQVIAERNIRRLG